MIDLLIVDDEKLILWGLKRDLERVGYRVAAFPHPEEAVTALEKQRFQAALVDVRLPGMNGLQLLEKIKKADPETQVIMITAFADVEAAVSSIRSGAFDFVLKPFSLEKIHLTIQNALEARQLKKEVASLKTERDQRRRQYELFGRSQRMQDVMQTVDRIGKAGAGVILLSGESGTGKGVIANLLHQIGPRAANPFIEVNCGAVPEALFESELFGHERGAFTGAVEAKKGLMEMADTGTLFLDEVGEMPLPIQTKFLKALEEQRIRRVGGTRAEQVDINIIGATHRDLSQGVRDGEFREDLFYRLNVVPIFLPPLRERGEDILLLAEHFREQFQTKYRRTFSAYSGSASQKMLSYKWPGNIRELRNSVERAVILETGEEIREESLGLGGVTPLPSVLPTQPNGLHDGIPEGGLDLIGHLEGIERRFLQQALTQSKGNQSQAAKILGMTRDLLRYRLKKYGMGEA